MNKSWTLEVKEDNETGDAILEFPDDLMQEAGWKEGDTLEWIDNKNGSWTMKKKELTQHNGYLLNVSAHSVNAIW